MAAIACRFVEFRAGLLQCLRRRAPADLADYGSTGDKAEVAPCLVVSG